MLAWKVILLNGGWDMINRLGPKVYYAFILIMEHILFPYSQYHWQRSLYLLSLWKFIDLAGLRHWHLHQFVLILYSKCRSQSLTTSSPVAPQPPTSISRSKKCSTASRNSTRSRTSPETRCAPSSQMKNPA